MVNELSENLRQNEIHNIGATSNIGYVKYGGWIGKKKLLNNSNADIFSLLLQQANCSYNSVFELSINYNHSVSKCIHTDMLMQILVVRINFSVLKFIPS